MRKKEEQSKAKEKLLEAAQDLMLTKGYVATTVDDICKAAKLTKGSFFHYFKSKDDLAKAVLKRFCCSSQEGIKDHCQCGQNEHDPRKRVMAHINHVVELSKDSKANKGCLIGKFAQELSETHPEIRVLCEEGFDQWSKMFKKDLSEAKAKYAPKAQFDVGSLADHFIAIVEGAQILAKAKRDRKIVEKSMMHFKEYLEILFK